MSAAELESALQDTLAKAKKTAWGSEEATPEVLLAMLAMYAIQEVHACGYVSTIHPFLFVNSGRILIEIPSVRVQPFVL